MRWHFHDGQVRGIPVSPTAHQRPSPDRSMITNLQQAFALEGQQCQHKGMCPITKRVCPNNNSILIMIQQMSRQLSPDLKFDTGLTTNLQNRSSTSRKLEISNKQQIHCFPTSKHVLLTIPTSLRNLLSAFNMFLS